ncbi:ABC-ATPase domain-containing protein [Clostridium haemolyticum]|uniref:Isopentenyl-diphosphate delta-isomerase n=1 Tax=Clostridium haemolyticum NCTC 9693 TaxID=1443114 RepID=A0ABR4TE49_CLOHA|nr:ABC-ATPase domain-containing protein [Clostridium haemolyticum]KEI15980.1 isopentenyl-diphosphate delta-isomerase [Clostridium haemolyticum NCTC 9693]KGN04594.1 isopentenyl-diphosphate delta-isomerase [Clostridium haemolyticum NCTC 8350]
MKSSKELLKILNNINGKGYKAYKDISGYYDFGKYILSVDSVQGDPFASPSRIRIIIKQSEAKFPISYFDKSHKRIAVVDFLTRLCWRNINEYYSKVKGSGKSGLLSIDKCGEEILDRTSIHISKENIEVRLEVGLPAAGRRILSKEAQLIFFNYLPKIIEKTLYFNNINRLKLKKHIELVEDQEFIRSKLDELGICAFVANGSILPRESGISQKPLKNNAIEFISPKELEIELDLPFRGKIAGMAIKKGVTLIVGGGYHGKSTLLKALEIGVYNHIHGDGREFVITDDSAVKVRAEDGRNIEKVDISMFINNLPNGKDTTKFSTENASGSTSQAANIVEAMECKTNLFLIDEDTSATNFMIRDEKMKLLVSNEKEPITPFIHVARFLYEKQGISTIIVVGSSGDYFNIADTVIMMDEYKTIDVTKRAKELCGNNLYKETLKKSINYNRILRKSSFSEEYKGVKIKTIGKEALIYNKSEINLRYLEQIVSVSQINAIGEIIKYIKANVVDDNLSLNEVVNKVFNDIKYKSIDVISSKNGVAGNLAMPRKYEVIATLNRFRELKIK